MHVSHIVCEVLYILSIITPISHKCLTHMICLNLYPGTKLELFQDRGHNIVYVLCNFARALLQFFSILFCISHSHVLPPLINKILTTFYDTIRISLSPFCHALFSRTEVIQNVVDLNQYTELKS